VYARTTLLEIDTVRISLDAALAQLETVVLPRLREQPGFRGLYALSTPEGRAMLISFWDTAEQADAGAETGWYPEVLDEYTTFFRSPPGRERYEVRLAVPPATAGPAA
jgi:heme-degrading monooxygenase HmoA